MASKNLPGDGSRLSLPRTSVQRDRHGSFGSVASRRLPNSEALGATLDDIHASASQSDALTTFSEYAPPPRSSAGSEAKNYAGELVQGGISGLYNRLRSSVGPSREAWTSSPPATLRSVESGDEASVKSVKLRAGHKMNSSVGTMESLPVVVSIPSSTPLKSPASSKFPEGLLAAAKAAGSSSESLASHISVVDHAFPGSSQSQSQPASSSLDPRGEPMPVRHVGTLQRAPDPVNTEHARRSSLADDDLPPVHSEFPPENKLQSIAAQTKEEESDSPPNSEGGAFEADPSTSQTEVVPLSRVSSRAPLDTPDAIARASNILKVETNSRMSSLGDGIGSDLARVDISSSQRPMLLQISQSHLPGYRPSRAASSDGDMSSATTVAASRHANPTSVSEAARRLELQKKASHTAPHMGNRLLAKEFWMRDENAKDCFYCGDTFTTVRRRHHCRTCGQIFDSKCTSILPGTHFGIGGSVRVCKPCEHIVNGSGDDSSVYSDSEEFPRHDHDLLTTSEGKASHAQGSVITPTIGIPVSRKDPTTRRSAVLEFDGGHPSLARPSSSRSLRSLSGRPHTPHKRHHSKHQPLRNFKPSSFDRAPFQGPESEGSSKEAALPAFHHDNIIDPDLAAFLSDEGSSDEESASLFATLDNEKPVSPARMEMDRPFNALFSSVRKGKSRDRNGRDPDAVSISSKHMPRHNRKRNISVNSVTQGRQSPRRAKSNSLLKGFPIPFSSSLALPIESESPIERPVSSSRSRMTRSASMRGEAAPPVELNLASLQHVRKMLRQLLQDSSIPSAKSWEKALVPILLKCTNDVNPDIRRHDFIDIRHYVKIKKVPGAKPGDTSYVSGVVFTKNVALKIMSRNISQPRIIIVTFAIEYERHNQHFISLDPVISQEKEYLRNLVRRIVAFHPQVLLVQKNVSGLALKLLADAEITVICNVKASVLNAVSRCTQTKLISSVDKLVFDPSQVGQCGSFDVKTYVSNNIKRTYVWLSGCKPDLGCSIVLRGAESETLRRLKRITEFMCYVVYNLRLETNLMRDEYVFIPPNPTEGTLSESAKSSPVKITHEIDSPALPAAASLVMPHEPMGLQYASNSATDQANIPAAVGESSTGGQRVETPARNSSADHPLTDSGSLPSFYDDVVEKHKTKILSTSPFVQFTPPYLLMQVREQEGRLARLKSLRDQYRTEKDEFEVKSSVTNAKFQLVQPEMVQGGAQKPSKQVKEFLYAVHNAEYDKAMFGYATQKRQWESYLSETINVFDPFSHQQIAFLYSMVNSQSTTPCIGPEVIALEFYNEQEIDDGFATDITLGQYIVDLIHGASSVCGINGCERTLFNHHRQYVHGPGQMSVYVQKHPAKLSGLQATLLMWSQCRICQAETPPIPMSDSTWRYSFGKYLELTFWSSELHPRAKVCPHDIHRDHLRYFGLRNAAVRIQFDPIQLHEVIIPRPVITWKVESDLKLKNDQYQKIKERFDSFMQSVKKRISSIHVEGVLAEKMELCKAELDRLTKQANEDHEILIRKLQEKYMKSRYYEVVPFNRAIRFMHEKAISWDDEFANFENNFFPSEKDIRRLAALQLRKLFIEKDESNTTSIGSVEEEPGHVADAEQELKAHPSDSVHLNPDPSKLTPEDAENMLASGLEKVNSQESRGEDGSSRHLSPTMSFDTELPQWPTPVELSSSEEIEGLDLALPENFSNSARATPYGSPEKMPIWNLSPTQMAKPAPDMSMPPPDLGHGSKIPRPIDAFRRELLPIAPPLLRVQSQPAEVMKRHQAITSVPSISSAKTDSLKASMTEAARAFEKRLTERLGGTLRVGRQVSQSLIPRSIPSKKKEDSRVSNLAKHFEQLTRELERERLRERHLRTARTKQARAYPLASSKPTVEVYPDVHQAVHGRTPSESQPESPVRTSTEVPSINDGSQTMSMDESAEVDSHGHHEERESVEVVDGSAPPETEHTPIASDADGEGECEGSDVEGLEEPPPPSPTEPPLDITLDLPKHEKTSLMQMLRSFWSERSASGWTPLEYPLLPNEHVWDNSDVIVREDEPSSIIALALSDRDYVAKLRSFRDQPQSPVSEKSEAEKDKFESYEHLSAADEASVERNLLRRERTHISYSFTHRGIRARCKIFYAESFDAVRRKCGIADRFVESMSRCKKWDSKGGKTRSLFLKTRDDRFVLKSLSQPEVTAFFKFAPNYFLFMHQILFKSLPSVIAKMFGLFQITIKNPATGVEFDWFMLVMENLFYHRGPDRTFDLKGSMRNRKIQSTGERDEVLQDENLVDIIFEKPLFVLEHTMTLLQACVWNDTLFLSQQNVMDYSLMAGFVDERFEIIVGIIDCIRTYTWDKKLETWIKDRGKNKPTITSPKDYKNRFRIAMSKYILLAPSCWQHFQSQIQKRPLRLDIRPEGQDAEDGHAQIAAAPSTTSEPR